MDKLNLQTNMRFVAAWFAASVTALIFAAILSIYLTGAKVVKPSIQSFKLFAALPQQESSVSGHVYAADARSKLIADFFKTYNTPLVNFGNTFVQVSDKYQLDWRLLPSIAMQESNGGKKVIDSSYNPFGYGIYGNLVTKFKSWDESIERVGRALREDYLNQGLKTPYQIMAKYTPPSLSKGGAWAKGVSSFMEELQ